MPKSFLTKLVIRPLLVLLIATAALPTAFAATYAGANGQTYTDEDFEFTNTDITVEPLYEGYARFCLETPEKYYEGYAVYATEGTFTSGLDQYTPEYYSKNTICYVYPEKFTADTTVSVHIYPYIELKTGAFKFLQPGYETTASVEGTEDEEGPVVTFEAGVNDFPDHNNYSNIEVIPYAYINVYEILEDSSLGYYKGTLKETIYTGSDGYADVNVTYGKMVNFLGFKSKTDAISSTYSTWKFSSPPYKNFGNDSNQLCQTNFFDFDEYLQENSSFACTTMLSVPYTVVDSGDDDWLSAVTITATSEEGGIYVDWNELSGLGTSFDKYNVLFKKGYYTSLTGSDVAKSYVDFNYYNLVGLTAGDWWTFQVVPVESVNGAYVEVGSKSNVLQVKVIGESEVSTLDTPYITSPYANQVLTNYPRTAYISWTDIDDADKYEVEVACDVCSSTTTKWLNPSTYTSTTNYLTTPALAGDNGFRVRVRALNSAGTITSSWSSYVYFSYDTSGYSDDATVYDMSLAITSWDDNGLPYVVWSAYDGTFDGYAMFVRKGFYDENEVTWEDPAYFGTSTTSHQMVKMLEYTTYTVRVLPYIQKTNGKEFVYPGSNTLHFTTSGDGDSSSGGTGQTLPPAGYEDDVITTFDLYNNVFPDTSLSTLEGQAAAELYRRGVIGGFPDGEFKGDRDVNRAELAKFLLLARYGVVNDVDNNGQFYDVLEGEWYVKFVVTAANYGIIDGYSDGSFKPANNVNVAEFCKMLTTTFGLSTNLSYSYVDVHSYDWFAQYAGVAEEYDLFPDGGSYLDPSHEMTRYEVAVAIYQFLLNR